METKVDESTTDTNNSLNTSTTSIDVEEETTEEEFKKAEEFKSKGNEAFKSNNILIALVVLINYVSI